MKVTGFYTEDEPCDLRTGVGLNSKSNQKHFAFKMKGTMWLVAFYHSRKDHQIKLHRKKSDNWWPAKTIQTQASVFSDRQLRMQRLI